MSKRQNSWLHNWKLVAFEFYGATIPLLQAIAWPLVIFGFAVAFRPQLYDIFEQLPALISKSSNITIGSFKVEVERKLETLASAEVREALKGLSSDAFYLLIQNGSYRSHVWTGQVCEKTKEELSATYNGLDELERRALVQIDFDSTDTCQADWHWSWTELGNASYDFVMRVLVDEFVKTLQ